MPTTVKRLTDAQFLAGLKQKCKKRPLTLIDGRIRYTPKSGGLKWCPIDVYCGRRAAWRRLDLCAKHGIDADLRGRIMLAADNQELRTALHKNLKALCQR